MTGLKAMFTLQVRKYSSGSRDSHGNPVDVWADPVDWPVFGYGPGSNDEPNAVDRDRSDVLWTVYAPVGGIPNERDRVILDGVEYEVDGRPGDYSHSPFGRDVGQGVVKLKRIEG